MVRVRLLAHQPEGITAGPVRAELRGVVCAEDECVAFREREVLLECGGLADVVSVESNHKRRQRGGQGKDKRETYTRPCVGSAMVMWLNPERNDFPE